MIFAIPNLLSREQIGELLSLAPGTFVDGMQTGGAYVRNIKNNREAELNSERVKAFDAIIQKALAVSNDFKVIAVPRKVSPFVFSSYKPGHFYGDHTDNAIMGIGTAEAFRADISMTIFLSEPTEYDGGELVVDTDLSPSLWKLPAGHAVLYPSYSLHRVEPVTRGERRAAVTWLQSYIREAERRQTLLDIAQVLSWMLNAGANGRAHEHAEFRRLEKVRANLTRMWSDG